MDTNLELQIKARKYLDEFDWTTAGVDVSFVIFFTGRCGSTHLAQLLRSSQLCGPPEEFFNETFMFVDSQATAFADYFRGIVRKYTINRRFGCQLDPVRLQQLREQMNFLGVFQPASTRYFWMTRSNMLAQAWSYALAKKTGIWHRYSDGSVAKTDIEGTYDSIINDSVLWRELLQIIEGERQIEGFFRVNSIQPQRITYEMFVAERDLTVIALLRELDVPASMIQMVLPSLTSTIVRNEYSDRNVRLLRFLEQYRKEYELIERERSFCNTEYIRKLLYERHNLEVTV